MGGKISRPAKKEILAVLRERYQLAMRGEKTRILDELAALAGCHRKHAIRLLGKSDSMVPEPAGGRRVYGEAVKEALIVLWEAADRICGKRLKALLPSLIEAMERHGHLDLDETVRQRLLLISAATIDRQLAPIRSTARGRRKRRRATATSQRVPVRTFSDWHEPAPGFFEIDFVVHCGGSVAGCCIHSLVATDVCSGWTEAVPLLAREQSLVVEGLEVLRRQIPVPLRGIDSDNDSAFINDTLLGYCQQQQIEFTRSRPYRKNDQAWIEQKNGAVVRRFVGHDRYSGMVAGQTLAHLYQALRLYVNFFQPSFKLREKSRTGSRTKKSYHPPQTPVDRLLGHSLVSAETKQALRTQRAKLDPLKLLQHIRDAQAALAALASPAKLEGPGRSSLAEFLAQLPRLWQAGEVRPTHRRTAGPARYWRTREDPFHDVWAEVLLWLQAEPDATAKALFQRLQREYPERFAAGQLRTLQRRIGEWRHVMARQLVYSSEEESANAGVVTSIGKG
jgi:hypothetical protein